jgi:hypothetical protein
MAIGRTTPAAITVGTALNSLASGSAAQTAEVTSGTGQNVTGITAKWSILLGAHTPSATTVIEVYVWGTNDDSGFPGGSATTEVISGSAGSITLSANGLIALRHIRSTLCPTASITVNDEADIVAILGYVPRRWGLVFKNSTGTAFASSGHSAEYVETYY